jgi:small subunit ribosomal protein S11
MSTTTNISTVKNNSKLRKINPYKSNQLSLLKQDPKNNVTKKIPVVKRIQSTPIQGVIHIKCSLNNTIATLTDLLGKAKAWVSCGTVGFKGSKRSSRFAGQAAIELLGSKAKILGYKHIVLHLNGLGRGRNVSVKSLKKSGLRIYFIKDFTSMAHNGCRPAKLRRL